MIQYRYDSARQRPFVPARPQTRARKPYPMPSRRPDALQHRCGGERGMECSALLRRIERALDWHGISASRFGREAANDPRLVFRFGDRRTCTQQMHDRLHAFIDQLDGEA